MIEIPVVHLNGTSKESLLFQYRAVMAYAKEATAAACEARPHARDYYIKSEADILTPFAQNGAFARAQEEYEMRVIEPLAQVTAYLEELLIGISDQQ